MSSKFERRCWNVSRLSITLLTSALLAACGDGSGGGGVAFPTAQGSGGASTSAAPGNGNATPPAGASAVAAPTLKEQIAALERSGAYPTLDRSADIAGPDTNNNGVRDDIEAWINAQHLNDGQKKALMQKARALNKTLLVDMNDKAALQKAGEGLGASFRCGLFQFDEYWVFSRLAGQIEAMTANTRQRAERYMQYKTARSASSTTNPKGNTCEL